jgi:hypothetical protein
MCEQNVEFFKVELGNTYRNHWALKVYGRKIFLTLFTNACHWTRTDTHEERFVFPLHSSEICLILFEYYLFIYV